MYRVSDSLLMDYLAESRELLTAIEEDLQAIERDGATIDEERIGRVFRAVHTIKGSSGLFDLVKIGELAHSVEGVLTLIQIRQIAPSASCVRVLLHAVDRLSDLIEDSDVSNQADIADVVAELDKLCADHRNDVQKSGAERGEQERQGAAKLRMLLAEDDFASRLLLQTFLSRYGECHVAVNGIEAVEAFRTALAQGRRYDLICMDIMMPGMDGREAVHQLRALEEEQGIWSTHGAKIFMTTTVSDLKQVSLCFKELCDAYLLKPIDLEKLLGQMKLFQLVN
jgi:two-component system, chemotaxis family, chemotaxis protein CheY